MAFWKSFNQQLLQGRLISLVAGHLLDSNSEERLGSDATEEYRTNLARNLADAIDLLPKLVRMLKRKGNLWYEF